MKSYEQALSEIYSKADKQLLQINKRKKRTQTILLTLAPVCLVLTIALSVGIGSDIGSTTPALNSDTSNNEMQNNFIDDNIIVGKDSNISYDIEPSIYPSAWESMNAVIVKWGEQNDQIWSESYGQYAHYEGQSFTVEYVGISVEFEKVFSDTMSKSLSPNVEKTIEQTTYLMIPKYCLGEIKAGDTALVFLDVIAHLADVEPDGTFKGTFTHILGVPPGDHLAPDKFIPAPIFAISNGKVIVPENAYEINPQNGEYYMGIMNALCYANEYIRKDSAVKTTIFENGVTVEKLTDFFAYICGK